MAAAGRRVHANAQSLVLAATAAGTAYLAASLLVGPQNAVFAPIAAVVATGLSAGQRVRRAAEISAGVVLGIVAADLLSRALGVGPLQLAVAVLLAMTAAVAIRPSGLMANQAAVAAVVVVALVPYLDAGPWVRLADALVGGTVAVVLNAVVAPDPYRAARAAASETLSGYAAVVRRLRGAVGTGSLAEAEEALVGMDALDGARGEIDEAMAATREVLARRGRAERRRSLEVVEAVAARVLILVSTGRGLCRASANLVRHDDAADSGTRAVLAAALDDLAGAIDQLREWLDGTSGTEPVRELALRAAATASGGRPRTQASAVLVGQIRSAAVDVLRITGLDQAAAVAALEEAAGRADLSDP
ncbi:FUSC family protein [Georgenia satyanarayanai]|uniref:FUSC family protein n=1 Tax=Georgenia satyanarayanai TaxID=860221 RepID=UPI00186B49A0|nr:FUSC family protein [Georgenia satyanarayanai]